MRKRILKVLLFVFFASVAINVRAVTTLKCVSNYDKTGICGSLDGCVEMRMGSNTFCVASQSQSCMNHFDVTGICEPSDECMEIQKGSNTFCILKEEQVNENEDKNQKCISEFKETGVCNSSKGCVKKRSNGTEQCFYNNSINPDSPGTYQNYTDSTVSCGDGLIKKMPALLPKTVSLIYIVLEIAIPVVLVIFGLLDLFKSLTAQKEDEIKKGQQIFVKRLITAVIVFFVFVITKALISAVADNNKEGIISCAECFIKNKCDE